MVDIQDAAYWRSCELWSLREAAYLLTGSEPRSEAEFRTQDRDAQSPVARTYRGLKDSTLAGSLAFKELDGIIDRRRITPRDAVTWAVRKGMEVSAVLAPLAAGTEDSPADEPPAPETRATSDDDALAALFDAVT
ncbi:MAG: hypothetical protein WCA12_21055, partial [Burkholderiales bacterium]